MSDMDTQTPAPIEEFREIDAATAGAEDGREKGQALHQEALTRFKQIVSREEESRVLGVRDLVFIDQEGGTYDETNGFLSGTPLDDDATGTPPPPPRYQIDRISPVIEEAVSDQREAQINIQVRSTGKKAEKGLADTMNGLIKNIESVSDAGDSYDNAFDECQKSGYGGWQIVTRYADEGFEQDIFIEPILNATQSLFFGPAKKATKEDALYAFHIWSMDLDEYNKQYPDAQVSDWPKDLGELSSSWFNSEDNLIRVAAYWRKRPVKKELYMLDDGRLVNEEDMLAATAPVPFFSTQPTVKVLVVDGEEMHRTVDTYEVERFLLNGTGMIRGPQPWAGRYIPLIPEYGIRSVVNSRETIRGKVRKGKDAQRLYDYATSAIVAAGALAAKDFHWMTTAQAVGHKDALEKMNINQDPIYFYEPDEQAPGPPVKAQGPTIQTALIGIVAQAREDISASVGQGVGLQDGTAQDPRSGEAIREGNVNREKGNSIYFNNHIRAVRYTGVQLADLISRLWTTEQQKRIIKPDGTEDFVTVNKPGMLEGEQIIINDLSQSRFDVTMDVGPAYASQRQQGADQLTKLATENAAFAAETPDLIAENLDVPGAKELSKRLRLRGIMEGRFPPTEDEREEFQIDLRAQITQEITPQIREEVTNETNIKLLDANANQLNAQADNFRAGAALKADESPKLVAETEKVMVETEKILEDKVNAAIEGQTKLLDNLLKRLDLQLPLTIVQKDQLDQQDDMIEDEQQEVDGGPTAAQEEEFNLN